MPKVPIFFKRLLLGAGVLLLLGAAALTWFVATEWTFLQRCLDSPEDSTTNVDWYVPKEPVAGGNGPPLPRAKPEEIAIDRAALEAAAKLADAKNASALLVVHEGKVVDERHWRGHEGGDWTNSASMAKTICALLVGIAVDEGRIASIDEPASRWLPAWRGDDRRTITLRHLLGMHSGLQPMGEYENAFSPALRLAYGTDMRRVVDTIPLVEPPGIRFDYSNVDYQALGFVIEAATGKRYATYLSEKLWKPLGLADAALWLDREGGSARTFGYIFAGPEDWAKIGLLFLHDGQYEGRQIIARDYLHSMRKPWPDESRYGLGIWLADNAFQARADEETFLAEGVYYLDGRFKQRVYVLPSHDLVLVRVGENGRGWDEAALPNAVLRGMPPAERATASLPGRPANP